MKNLSTVKSLLASAETLTVVNDGAVRYAVPSLAIAEWESVHGEISGDKYDDFCSAVPYVLPALGTPGNTNQNRLCECLINRGANQRRF